MDQNTAITIYIIIIISSLIGILITLNLLVYYCCLRPRKNGSSTLKKNKSKKTGDKNLNINDKLLNDQTIININETNNQLLTNQALDSDVYKYLGISLSEIPFIDEDSKASSLVDLNWNPYKPLSN